ncbi:helix-turn-helix domain-containing protein (plasmid) [Skermanella rosea]|nr:helix-turn-helix domain-containing protein [Skermanella rosea]
MLTRPLMTVQEVADLLKISDDTVREWIHDRSLRAIKFGREWRIVARDLESFLNARANRPEGDGP